MTDGNEIERSASLPEGERLRLYAANERTVLAWVRTALAIMGLGFIVARFGLFLRELARVGHDGNDGSMRATFWIGIAVTLLGTVVLAGAMMRYNGVRRDLDRNHVHHPGGTFVLLIGGLLIAAGIALALVLVVTR